MVLFRPEKIGVARNRERAWIQIVCTVAILHQGARGVIAVKGDDFTSRLWEFSCRAVEIRLDRLRGESSF